MAGKLAEEGDTHLAEFATTHGKKLGAFIASARDVLDTPRRAIEAKKTLLDKLMRASREAPCKCAGQWQPGAALVLQNQRIPIADFCRQFLWALGLGAARGVNMALVGRGGCGKSMLLSRWNLFSHVRPSRRRAALSFPLEVRPGDSQGAVGQNPCVFV